MVFGCSTEEPNASKADDTGTPAATAPPVGGKKVAGNRRPTKPPGPSTKDISAKPIID